MESKKKAKRGRPKAQPMYAERLRQIAKANRERTAAAKNKIDPEQVENALIKLGAANDTLEGITRSELREMKRCLQQLWDIHIQNQWADEDTSTSYGFSSASDTAVSSAPVTKMMKKEDWNAAHASVFKKARKNRKVTPNIYTLKPERYVEYGLTNERTDRAEAKAMEVQIELDVIKNAIKDQKEKPQPLKGRRITERMMQQTSRQNFWL